MSPNIFQKCIIRVEKMSSLSYRYNRAFIIWIRRNRNIPEQSHAPPSRLAYSSSIRSSYRRSASFSASVLGRVTPAPELAPAPVATAAAGVDCDCCCGVVVSAGWLVVVEEEKMGRPMFAMWDILRGEKWGFEGSFYGVPDVFADGL